MPWRKKSRTARSVTFIQPYLPDRRCSVSPARCPTLRDLRMIGPVLLLTHSFHAMTIAPKSNVQVTDHPEGESGFFSASYSVFGMKKLTAIPRSMRIARTLKDSFIAEDRAESRTSV